MSLIAALLETIIVDGAAEAIRPRSARGWVGRATIFGVAAILINGWLWSAASLPGWAEVAIITTLIGGSIGIIASAIHFAREPYDRLLCSLAILLNATAVMLALFI